VQQHAAHIEANEAWEKPLRHVPDMKMAEIGGLRTDHRTLRVTNIFISKPELLVFFFYLSTGKTENYCPAESPRTADQVTIRSRDSIIQSAIDSGTKTLKFDDIVACSTLFFIQMNSSLLVHEMAAR
jgi:hypothetical protein